MSEDRLRVSASGRGRALYVDARGAAYVSRGSALWRSDDGGARWTLDASLPLRDRVDPRSWSRPLRRLFRREIHALEVASDGARVAVARRGLYRAEAGSTELRLVFPIERGSRPLGLDRDDRDRFVFGEYGGNSERHEMHLYASTDGARSFHVCHTFPARSIRHVHGVLHDPSAPGFWVFTGDSNEEAGIGLLDADLRSFRWCFRGSQSVRVVRAILAGGALVYGTDSHVEANAIVRLETRSGRIDRLQEVEGSSYYSGSFGGVGVISTCVEPSRVNRSREVVLYASRDLADWRPVVRGRKDSWPSLFQFGTFVLARSRAKASTVLASGQAVAGSDERFSMAELGKA